MVVHGAHACTDVTGFGLMGHLVEMARGSGVAAEIDMAKLPVFAAVPDCIENEILSGGIERNQEYTMAWVRVEDEASEKNLPILFDPQTSGGLLVSLPESAADAYVKEMRGRGHCAVFIVGRVLETSGSRRAGTVSVIGARLENLIGERKGILMTEQKNSPKEPAKAAAKTDETACCASPPVSPSSEPCCASGASVLSTPSIPSTASIPPAESERAFAAFMREANKPGLIDARGKRLMAVALSIAQKCEPCLKIHITKALEEGLSMDEIDEAAWLAISFCGSPAMMFYKEIRSSLE
jgi:AhpD family alkylhydroperoxidase